MSIFVVGGDNIGNISQKLAKSGFSQIQHVSGRNSGDIKTKISSDTDLVLVLVDFINHALVNVIKKETKKNGVNVTFSKRSWIHIENSIQNFIKE